MIASALAGGVIGTLALATIIKAAAEAGITRLDVALLLGTAVTDNRRKARAIGYIFHFVLGIAFAEAYGAFFAIVGHASWRLGAQRRHAARATRFPDAQLRAKHLSRDARRAHRLRRAGRPDRPPLTELLAASSQLLAPRVP